MSDASTLPRVRVDWTIPAVPMLVFVIGLVGQGLVIGSIYGALSQRLASVEEKVREIGTTPETVARLDERTKAMQDDLGDIKQRLGQAH